MSPSLLLYNVLIIIIKHLTIMHRLPNYAECQKWKYNHNYN